VIEALFALLFIAVCWLVVLLCFDVAAWLSEYRKDRAAMTDEALNAGRGKLWLRRVSQRVDDDALDTCRRVAVKHFYGDAA
jgi:hypothetical protein